MAIMLSRDFISAQEAVFQERSKSSISVSHILDKEVIE
jgi:hypothetical protein